MAFKIAISLRAESNLDDIVTYLEMEWPAKVKEDFLALAKGEDQVYFRGPVDVPSISKEKVNQKMCVGRSKYSLL